MSKQEPPLTEPEIIECEYLTGANCYLSEDGQSVITIGWVSCPIVSQRRITLRAAASRSSGEEYCRELMKVLDIKEEKHKV